MFTKVLDKRQNFIDQPGLIILTIMLVLCLSLPLNQKDTLALELEVPHSLGVLESPAIEVNPQVPIFSRRFHEPPCQMADSFLLGGSEFIGSVLTYIEEHEFYI